MTSGVAQRMSSNLAPAIESILQHFTSHISRDAVLAIEQGLLTNPLGFHDADRVWAIVVTTQGGNAVWARNSNGEIAAWPITA